MSKRSKLENAIGVLQGMGKKHECKTLQESKVDISVETISGKWYWIFWEKDPVEAHGIDFCPYCGEKLEKEEDHESKDNYRKKQLGFRKSSKRIPGESEKIGK